MQPQSNTQHQTTQPTHRIPIKNQAAESKKEQAPISPSYMNNHTVYYYHKITHATLHISVTTSSEASASKPQTNQANGATLRPDHNDANRSLYLPIRTSATPLVLSCLTGGQRLTIQEGGWSNGEEGTREVEEGSWRGMHSCLTCQHMLSVGGVCSGLLSIERCRLSIVCAGRVIQSRLACLTYNRSKIEQGQQKRMYGWRQTKNEGMN